MFLFWKGHRVKLTDRTITVGRRAKNDIVIKGDPFVSKSHCAITNGTLMDLSKNGTKVNGSRVQKVPNHFSWRVICLFLGTTLVENEVPNRDANGF